MPSPVTEHKITFPESAAQLFADIDRENQHRDVNGLSTLSIQQVVNLTTLTQRLEDKGLTLCLRHDELEALRSTMHVYDGWMADKHVALGDGMKSLGIKSHIC